MAHKSEKVKLEKKEKTVKKQKICYLSLWISRDATNQNILFDESAAATNWWCVLFLFCRLSPLSLDVLMPFWFSIPKFSNTHRNTGRYATGQTDNVDILMHVQLTAVPLQT